MSTPIPAFVSSASAAYRYAKGTVALITDPTIRATLGHTVSDERLRELVNRADAAMSEVRAYIDNQPAPSRNWTAPKIAGTTPVFLTPSRDKLLTENAAKPKSRARSRTATTPTS